MALSRSLSASYKASSRRNKFTHPQSFGCCSGTAHTRERLVAVLLTFFVFRRPPVLALNKWTKPFPALSFWFVTTNPFNFIGRL